MSAPTELVAMVAAAGAVALLMPLPRPSPATGPDGSRPAWERRLEPTSVRRRRERLAASVPHAVDLMAACLAAGLSPAAALEQITAAVDAPLCEELAAVSARLRLGVDPATVWRDLAGHPQLGGLGRTVSDLRRRGRAEVESRARAVGVKAALPLGICLLPAFVLVGVVPLVAGSVSVLVQR